MTRSPEPGPAPLGNPASLLDVLDRSRQSYAARPLFAIKDRSSGRWGEITYQQFAALVDEVRGGLASVGIGPGDRVGIVVNNRLEWAAIAYACYGLRAALVPMYESQHEKEWAFIARDAGCKVLFV